MGLLFFCPSNKCNCWEALLVWGRWEGAVEVSPRHMSLASEIWWGQCLNSISWYFRLSRKVGTEPKLSDILNGSWLFDLLLVTLLKLSTLSGLQHAHLRSEELRPKVWFAHSPTVHWRRGFTIAEPLTNSSPIYFLCPNLLSNVSCSSLVSW